ncbi:MAG TPA: class I SAM-dependent methyltransferase [Desulfatirhabdiaceae bacterium]|nr:class I SAM-dependent methyltransferase [Desulfatirhabdiaceae bacterium]
MSRLDSYIRRMQAQRDCLNWAAQAVSSLPGIVLELGLGNGRTYDHLRELLPERDIYVFEREVRGHANSLPPEKFLIVGNVEDMLLSAADHLPSMAALAHIDLGTSDAEAYKSFARLIGPLLYPLMTSGGIIVSNIALTVNEFIQNACPPNVKPGRYFVYRNNPKNQNSGSRHAMMNTH